MIHYNKCIQIVWQLVWGWVVIVVSIQDAYAAVMTITIRMTVRIHSSMNKFWWYMVLMVSMMTMMAMLWDCFGCSPASNLMYNYLWESPASIVFDTQPYLRRQQLKSSFQTMKKKEKIYDKRLLKKCNKIYAKLKNKTYIRKKSNIKTISIENELEKK